MSIATCLSPDPVLATSLYLDPVLATSLYLDPVLATSPCSPPNAEPPVITKEMGIPIVTALAGTNVSLACPTEANPDPMYQWLVNDTALEDSAIAGRFIVEVVGQQLGRNFGVRLNISFVREGDNGLYNCSAFNVIPGVEGTFQDSYLVELQIQRTCLTRALLQSVPVLLTIVCCVLTVR